MKKTIQEGKVKNSFLENLKQAVESGDSTKGAESINKINEIHKLASSMNGDIAKASLEKRIEESGGEEAIDEKEAKVLNFAAKEEILHMKEEDLKLKLLADISNGESELKAVNKEFKEVSKQYFDIIEKQEDMLEILKNKLNEKYEKDGEEKADTKENGEG